MPSLAADDDSLALAAALHAAWQNADPELRNELERVMRDYVRRKPSFRAALDAVARLHEQARPVRYPRRVSRLVTFLTRV